MFLLFPVQTEVVFLRWPWMNFCLIGSCIVSYICLNIFGIGYSVFSEMVLQGWSPFGLLGHMFCHAGFLHLFGNMVFLWVFGNALNERMGQLRYLLFFLSAGTFAGVVHLLMDGGTAIGASGAVNGVVGAYLILYPTNRVSCFWLLFVKGGVIQISGYWLIGFWFFQDVLGVAGGGGYIAYWAHLGGMFYGVAIGTLLLRTGKVSLSHFDNPDLLTLLKLQSPQKETEVVSDLMPGEMGFDCPECGKPQRVRETQLGEAVKCWACRTVIQLEEEA